MTQVRRRTRRFTTPWAAAAMAVAVLAGLVPAVAGHAGVGSPSPASQSDWVRMDADGPRHPGYDLWASASDYDPVRRQVVVFGGSECPSGSGCSSPVITDSTWTYGDADAEWARLRPAARPSARWLADMAWFPPLARMVLFGGQGFDPNATPGTNASHPSLNDTWAFDGTNWQELHPSHSPPPRSSFEVAYDPERRNIVLFGGQDAEGNALGDTWVFDGDDWAQQAPAQSPGLSAADSYTMAYVPRNHGVVLFDRRAQDDPPGNPGGCNCPQTWVWDGATWNRLFPQTGPHLTGDSHLVYDPVRQNAVLYGQSSPNEVTYTWDGSDWHFVDVLPPYGRLDPVFVWAAAIERVFMFGGGSGAGLEEWTWDGSTWERLFLRGSLPEGRVYAAMSFDSDRQESVLFGGVSSHTLDDTWVWNGRSWRNVATPGAHPRARNWASMAYDPVRRETILFGGRTADDGAKQADTWAFDGTSWTERAPAARPPAREGASMAFDAPTGKVVLFGGASATGGALGDTWTWDGSAWTEERPAAAPPARQYAMMTRDGSGTPVLFGGGNGVATLDADTWRWAGPLATWVPVQGVGPPARYGAGMGYDEASRSIVLFGGCGTVLQLCQGGFLDDTWAFDGTAWRPLTPVDAPTPRWFPAMADGSAEVPPVLGGGGGGAEPCAGILQGCADYWQWGTSLSSVWAGTGPLNVPRTEHTATALPGGGVLVTGGCAVVDLSQPCAAPTATAERYDRQSGAWALAAPMSVPRAGHTATLLNDGRVLVAGGCPASERVQCPATGLAELYDPATGTWLPTPPMAQGVYLHTATLLGDGRVVVAGGRAADGSFSTAIQVYDPATGLWSTGPALLAGRASHTAATLPGGRVLFAGGEVAEGTTADAEVFDPATGRETAAPAMGMRRYGHTSTALADGRVLVAGGFGGTLATDTTALPSTEIYDPATGGWAAAAALSAPRAGAAATLARNGKVFVIGGMDEDSVALRSADLYDPAKNAWTGGGFMLQRRSGTPFDVRGPTSTLLSTGELLVAGGTSSPVTELARLRTSDLSVTVDDRPDPAVVGGELTYTVTASNQGPDLAPAVVVDDRLPGGVTVRSSGASRGTCQESLRAVTCDLGSLAAGASATVTVTVVAPTAGTLQDTATVRSDAVDDPVPADNTATATTTVATSADLGLTIADSPDPVGRNKTLTYTVDLANAGPSAASGVVVQDSLPATVVFLSATTTRGSCAFATQRVTCSLGTLASDATATVKIAVRTTVKGTVTNRAEASGDDVDPNTADNAASTTTTVR